MCRAEPPHWLRRAEMLNIPALSPSWRAFSAMNPANRLVTRDIGTTAVHPGKIPPARRLSPSSGAHPNLHPLIAILSAQLVDPFPPILLQRKSSLAQQPPRHHEHLSRAPAASRLPFFSQIPPSARPRASSRVLWPSPARKRPRSAPCPPLAGAHGEPPPMGKRVDHGDHRPLQQYNAMPPAARGHRHPLDTRPLPARRPAACLLARAFRPHRPWRTPTIVQRTCRPSRSRRPAPKSAEPSVCQGAPSTSCTASQKVWCPPPAAPTSSSAALQNLRPRPSRGAPPAPPRSAVNGPVLRTQKPAIALSNYHPPALDCPAPPRSQRHPA